jgi:hypothetical protein
MSEYLTEPDRIANGTDMPPRPDKEATPWGFWATVGFSCAIGMVYCLARTGSIRTTVVMHALMNLVATAEVAIRLS